MASPLKPLSASNQNIILSPSLSTRSTGIKSFTTTTWSQSHTMADDISEHYEEEFDTAHTRISFSDSSHKLGRSRSKSPIKHGQAQLDDQLLGTHNIQLTQDALRENDRAVDILNNSIGSLHYSDNGNDSMSMVDGIQGYAEGADDTCFSTFSAVPNADMTLFAAQTARASTRDRPTTPMRSSRPTSPIHTTPGTIRAKHYDSESPSSPTNRHKTQDSGDTTNLMLDFTEQFNFRRPSPKKHHTQSDLCGAASDQGKRSPVKYRVPATPSQARLVANLLDFDIPPAPTPRSILSVTAHEVEIMKSGFLSQISSLRATLSGRDAEAKSLKVAVEDAERRVGQAMEQARINREEKESLQAEKVEWERRDKEMQTVLRSAKDEIVLGQRERDSLTQNVSELESKLFEAEKKREEAENKTAEAESKAAGLEASVVSTPAPGSANGVSTPGSSTTKAVEVAVERVARELHTLYKTKHENKVLALKKSYEARWEKRIREMQQKIDEVSKENEELRVGRDATMSGVVPSSMTIQAEKEQREDEQQEARFKELEGVLETLKKENDALAREIEKERAEKGDLVAAAEEMLEMQMQLTAASNAPLPPSPQPSHMRSESNPYARPPSASESHSSSSSTTISSTVPTNNSLRGSLARPTGLKGPGFAGESRIGMGMGMMRRNGSGNTHASAGSGRSGIMGNIERMGRGAGAGTGAGVRGLGLGPMHAE
ncbi:MAG: hypothetical protein MMC33_004820 [Icmadophila ericetorum]|nr:hypothetical protein [Icmadophila ericetorum]